jgi:hypothetical protein
LLGWGLWWIWKMSPLASSHLGKKRVLCLLLCTAAFLLPIV